MTAPNRQRHKWGKRNPISKFKTERRCQRGCGLVKVTWHRDGKHWQEFWRGFDQVAGEGEPTPQCVPQQEMAS